MCLCGGVSDSALELDIPTATWIPSPLKHTHIPHIVWFLFAFFFLTQGLVLNSVVLTPNPEFNLNNQKENLTTFSFTYKRKSYLVVVLGFVWLCVLFFACFWTLGFSCQKADNPYQLRVKFSNVPTQTPRARSLEP